MFQKSSRIPSFLPAPARAAATMWGTPLTRPSGSAPAAKSFCTLAGWPRHISLFTRRASASSVSFVPSPVPFIFTARGTWNTLFSAMKVQRPSDQKCEEKRQGAPLRGLRMMAEGGRRALSQTAPAPVRHQSWTIF